MHHWCAKHSHHVIIGKVCHVIFLGNEVGLTKRDFMCIFFSFFFWKKKGFWQKVVESKEASEGGSHLYTISLYEEVA
jgi:hypothetical protein